jgi:hypothetical protein
MIEDGRFIGAGSLSNAVANLKADGRLRKRFEAHYGNGNFDGTNLVDSIVNLSRTLLTANGPFDRFCGGRDALDAECLAGFGEFKARRCAQCHSGPSLGTRVVTEDGVRVPSLRGLARRRVFQANGRLYSDLAAAVAKLGVKTIIYTDTATDGMLGGPNLAQMAAICDAAPSCDITASGGVSSPQDVKNLIALGRPNLRAAIVGKALYDGRVTLAEMNGAGAL